MKLMPIQKVNFFLATVEFIASIILLTSREYVGIMSATMTFIAIFTFAGMMRYIFILLKKETVENDKTLYS